MSEIPVLILALVAALFVGFFLLTRRSMPYVFCNATLSAWEARLLSESRLAELANAPSPEAFLSALEETDYRNEVLELRGSGAPDPVEFERALRENAGARYREMLSMLPEERRGTVARIVSMTDIWNLKAIISMIASGVPPEKRAKELLPSPTMSGDRLEMLASAKTLDELLEYLRGSEYGQAIRDVMAEYEKKGLRAVLLAVDRCYWQSLWRDVMAKRGQRKTLMQMVGYELDSLNARLVLRLKQEGAPPDEIYANLVRPSHELTEAMLRAMVTAGDLVSAVNMIHLTVVGRVLLEASRDIGERGALAAEEALEKGRMRLFRWLGMTKFFTIAPALSYIAQKEAEVRRLREIYRTKFDGARQAPVEKPSGGIVVEA